MRRNEKKRMHAGHHIMQVLCVVLLLALLALMLTVELRQSDEMLERESAHATSYTYVDRLAGYVFRTEATVTDGDRSGALRYLVADGAAVSSGDDVLLAYEIGRAQNEREEAAKLYAEIAYLTQCATAGDRWQTAYMESYVAMMQGAGLDDWQSAYAAAIQFLPTLRQGSVTVSGGAEAVSARIAELESEVAELLRHAGDPKSIAVPMDGRFGYGVDGYEAIFGLSEAADGALTPERLDVLLGKNNVPARTAGKVADMGEFYLAVPVTEAEAAHYTAGERYEIRMTRGGCAEAAELSYISHGAEGDRALLVFHVDEMPAGMDLARRQTLEIKRNTVEGIGVPDGAICTEGENTFVYVIENGRAVRRRAEVLCREGGCCVVAAKNEEGYLRAGERVLISAREGGVYEGMVLSK